MKARFYPPTIPDLRNKLERSENTERVPQDLMELIEQHGARGWVDALIEKAGPTVQLHLEDSADLMEVLTKYAFHLRLRRRTMNLLVLCLIAVLLTVAASKNGAIHG